MTNNFSFAQKVILGLGIFVIAVVVSQYFRFNWGRLELAPTATVTVTGEADGQQLNQVASFTASVTVSEADKETATQAVNEAMTELIEQVKAFGIPEEDLQTESVSVYEYETEEAQLLIYPAPPVRDGGGELRWQASNTLSIALRDVDRASELATLLTESGATNVYGPNFRVDDSTSLDRQLLEEAMTDAREKAELLLSGTNQRIARVISVSEAGGGMPIPYYRSGIEMAASNDMALSVPTEPGSQTLYKSITVVFEID